MIQRLGLPVLAIALIATSALAEQTSATSNLGQFLGRYKINHDNCTMYDAIDYDRAYVSLEKNLPTNVGYQEINVQIYGSEASLSTIVVGEKFTPAMEFRGHSLKGMIDKGEVVGNTLSSQQLVVYADGTTKLDTSYTLTVEGDKLTFTETYAPDNRTETCEFVRW